MVGLHSTNSGRFRANRLENPRSNRLGYEYDCPTRPGSLQACSSGEARELSWLLGLGSDIMGRRLDEGSPPGWSASPSNGFRTMDQARADEIADADLTVGRGCAEDAEPAKVEECADFFDDEPLSLEELAESLEVGGESEQALAFEGLASLEPEIRVQIIEGLGTLTRGPGLSAFLDSLARSADPATSAAAQLVLNFDTAPDAKTVQAGLPAIPEARIRRSGESNHPLIDSLVTAVDGEGRGTIAIEAIREGTRRSAVFRCDIQKGIVRTVGRIESDSLEAGSLIDEASSALPSSCDRLRDVPELALLLLAGSLTLGHRSRATASARSWVDDLLGPGFRPTPIPIPVSAIFPDRAEAASLHDIPRHVDAVLDVCPAWLDRSALTVELAEEIELREGKARPTDSSRHAGAYRYLFEHRLIHRLDLYGRMLLWMAWFWRSAEDPGLSNSAIAIALELADEQFAVPSHPFARALMTRSLEAARLDIRARRS